jgi:tetratricopeptide (TPR) repeat protein
LVGTPMDNTSHEGNELPDFDKLWDYDDPEGTGRQFREIIGGSERPGDRAYVAELMTQIARTEGLSRRFEEAHRTLDQVETELAGLPLRVRVRYLLERGRVLRSSGHAEASRPYFLQAWQLGLSGGEELEYHTIDAAHMVAIASGSAEDKLAWELKALGLAEQASQPRARSWIVSLYNNIGWSYHDMGRHEEALDMFRRVLSLRSEQNDEVETRIERWMIGKELRFTGRVEDALEIQRGLEQEWDADGKPSGYVYEELGEDLWLLGQEEEARRYFGLAYRELSQDPWMVADEPGRLERLKQLGGVD